MNLEVEDLAICVKMDIRYVYKCKFGNSYVSYLTLVELITSFK